MIGLFPSAADDSPSSAAQPSPPPVPWTSLSDGEVVAPDAVSPRRVLAQVAAAALVVVIVVGIAGALVSRRVAEQQSVHDVAELTDVLAQGIVSPALTDELLTDPGAAVRVLDPIMRAAVLSDSLIRVKLWTPDGTILYSDEPRLLGQTFDLDHEARDALTTPQVEASVSDLTRPENRFERSDGRLLEVYRPVWTPAGHPLLFETYFRYDAVGSRSSGLWRGFVGIIVSSLIALLLLLTPIVWSLLRRTRHAQDQRQAMMTRALAASDAERSRIAGSLHDGVVQELVAGSLDIAARGERAAAVGDEAHAADLRSAAATLRSSVGVLRSLLVDIYPPQLDANGLPAALHDLVATLRSTSAELVLDVEAAAVDRLTPPAREAVFRVAQEALRNAVAHAQASRISLDLYEDAGTVWLHIADDGIGFDAASTPASRSGHLGLALIVDVARQSGAALQVASAPGRGTHYRMELGTS